MFSKIRWNLVASTLAALVAALVVTSAPAEAQAVRPFKIYGRGVGPHGLPLPGQPARPHWAVGEASYLGRYVGQGSVQTDSAAPDPTTGHLVGQFGGGSPFVFVGQNGDRLVTWYGRTDHGASQPGSVDLRVFGTGPDGSLIVQAYWVAEFVAMPHASTGNFAGVTGSWIMYAQSDIFLLGSDLPVGYSWQGEGYLAFRGRR